MTECELDAKTYRLIAISWIV